MKCANCKVLVLAALLLTAAGLSSCSSSSSYACYEFYCEGDMTVSCEDVLAAVQLSDEDIHTLLGLWGKPWTAEKVWSVDFDYTFRWENTTIHYASTWGIFSLEGSGQIVKLFGDERKTVNEILDKYV